MNKHLINVAIPCPLNQTFSYTSPKKILQGSRVKVPFGPRSVIGTVLNEPLPRLNHLDPIKANFSLKSIIEVIDKEPIFSEKLISLALWMSAYYHHPIGEVFKTMLPASDSKTSKTFLITEKGKELISLEDHKYAPLLKHLFQKKEKLQESTLKKKHLDFSKTIQANLTIPTLKTLQKQLLIQCTAVSRKNAQDSIDVSNEIKQLAFHLGEEEKLLNDEQNAVTAELYAELERARTEPKYTLKPFLLKGVTGSGKTEVYLQLIRHIIETSSSAQALVLVPEIALTPQMTLVFTRRFPNQVAVVHSAISAKERWTTWKSCHEGTCRILIGARSAVFAPFKHLGLIIIDEEHDTSYKQQSQFCYHARDIAVVRAKLERVPLLLGSATPSLESYSNALEDRYQLLQLKKRVGSKPLPEIKISETDPSTKTSYLLNANEHGSEKSDDDAKSSISEEVINALSDNFENKNQAIVLVNRRGYAHFLLEAKEKTVVECPACSISLSLHKNGLSLHCHYCEYRTSFANLCKENPEGKYFAIGHGSQKAEESLKRSIPKANIVRLDSDVAANKEKLHATLKDFREGKIDILVGTQILAKGHDFPNVTLSVLLNVDQALNLPDFRAGEKSFQLLVQAAGRSGRGEKKGTVLINTMLKDHPIIESAIKHDYLTFAKRELLFRKSHGYPPYSRMIHWLITCKNSADLDSYCNKIEHALDKISRDQPEYFKNLKIQGPQTPMIEKIMHRYRRTLLFSSSCPQTVHRISTVLLQKIPRQTRDIRLNIDVDPQSLL